MPRPPILPTVDWKSLLEQGKSWDQWLAEAESDENRDKMQSDFDGLTLPPPVEAALKALPREVHIVAFAEDWCGDVVRHVPLLAKLAAASPKITLRFLARETSPETFARFLTNGGEAIPKFVFLSDTLTECGSWGPMPAACRAVIARGKASGKGKEARERVSKMYEADPAMNDVLAELRDLIWTAVCAEP